MQSCLVHTIIVTLHRGTLQESEAAHSTITSQGKMGNLPITQLYSRLLHPALYPAKGISPGFVGFILVISQLEDGTEVPYKVREEEPSATPITTCQRPNKDNRGPLHPASY